MKGNMTRQQAINAMCKGCIYDEHDKGTWKRQVELCTSKCCPLYPYRPLSEYGKIDSSSIVATRGAKDDH